ASGDYASIYYNPAAMVRSASSVGGGISLTFDGLRLLLADRPEGYDIPDLGVASPAIASDLRLRDREDVEGTGTTVNVMIGATTSLGVERLRLGFAAMLPVAGTRSQQSVFPDEREQFYSNSLNFDLLGGRVDHSVVLVAAAYELTDWFALGIGLSFMPAATTDNAVYTDSPVDLSDVDINVDLGIEGRFRPNAGMLFSPTENLRVGLAFRDEQYLRVSGTTEVQVRGLQDQEDYPFYQPLDLTIQYSPRQFALGLSWEDDSFVVGTDFTFYQWSRYPDHHGERAGFDDTYSIRVGGEYEFAEGHILRAGIGWEPTPVPHQSGRTNYVDNSRVLASLGSGHEIPFGDSALKISWHIQLHFLLENTELKAFSDNPPECEEGVTVVCDEVPDDTIDRSTGQPYPEAAGLQTGNPGFPGWTSGGWMASSGVEVSWEF
ncbi:MAG: outer membrane protein transport protein, partial [Myxococcales bacterium]|nr:outer membrane protein transport protein [Myxococcales bacterium]